MKVSIIVAMSNVDRVIGKQGDLPWHIPKDFKFFKQTTLNKPIIMGRKTWESLPKRPLPKRTNIVITQQESYEAEGAVVCHSIQEAISHAEKCEADEAFVIGGEQIYKLALDESLVDKIYLTKVYFKVKKGDTFFPEINEGEWKLTRGYVNMSPDDIAYRFDTYERP